MAMDTEAEQGYWSREEAENLSMRHPNETVQIKASRGILPDGMDEKRFVIIKACMYLRLTEELQSAAKFAIASVREFILTVPAACHLEQPVVELIRSVGGRIVRTSE
jgi:hypothetical protein